jgi:Uma2 family endonuclease
MEQLTIATPVAYNFSDMAALKAPIPIEERDDVTVDELERLWTTLPYPAELYNGRVVYKMANYAHGKIQTNLIRLLGKYLDNHPIGDIVCETNFRLWDERPNESRIPDVCFVAKDRVPQNMRRFPAMSPDLAVEIVAEDDSYKKISEKVKAYLQQGAKMVWVIYASTREVLVCTAKGKHYAQDVLTAPEVLPEFELPVQEIFAGVEE